MLSKSWTPVGKYRWLRIPFGIRPFAEEYHCRQQTIKRISIIADDILVYGVVIQWKRQYQIMIVVSLIS
ncbi:hypothetical protein G0U57_015772 [Chelydra serpentina]|uniref:Uncharacterized protein n=1 Tax=Chelydra serpentina TaxID=8475 RepID=A0A8T1T1M3_CHESE|nr:hypothetical protein G0U57_015772 [Chelydra serpentina]